MSKVTTAPLGDDIQRQFETLRAKNDVAPVKTEDEGAPLGGIPAKVYGFTYSPLNASTPLYAARTLQSFEVHKVTESSACVLGFLTADEARTVLAGAAADVHLYPEPSGEAKTLVEIALERIVRSKPLARGEGNFMALHLDPQ